MTMHDEYARQARILEADGIIRVEFGTVTYRGSEYISPVAVTILDFEGFNRAYNDTKAEVEAWSEKSKNGVYGAGTEAANASFRVQFMDNVRKGKYPMAKKVEVEEPKVQDSAIHEPQTPQTSMAGFAPVVPLVLARVPNSMINCHVEPKKSRVLDVYYDATMGCGNGPDVLIEMGMKAVEYILRAEAQGYRVRLTAVQMYYNNGSADVLMVRIKNENQPLNIQRMMFPMFHPAFFRVIGFGWYERCPTSKHRGGYGHSMAYDYDVKEMNRMFEGMLGKQAIYLSAVHIQKVHAKYGETKDEARSRLVKDTLKMEAQA